MRYVPALFLALALVQSACTGGDPKALTSEGYAAMNKGDSSAAVAKFEQALEKLDASSPDYLAAAMGRCQAFAKVDAKKCQHEFLKLAQAIASEIKDKDYKDVASRLAGAKQFMPAIAVMHAGNERFKNSPAMLEITRLIIEESKKAQDVDALKELKGLGYI